MGDLGRGAAMSRIIRFNRVNSRQNVFHGFETEQAPAAGNKFAKTGFLSDHRPAGGEVARGSVAEPAGPGPHVLVAGHGEFSTGVLNVLPVEGGVAGNLDRRSLSPPVRTQ